MKHRRHHNNTGYRSIRSGDNEDKVRRIAQKLGIPYGTADKHEHQSQMKSSDLSAGETESK